MRNAKVQPSAIKKWQRERKVPQLVEEERPGGLFLSPSVYAGIIFSVVLPRQKFHVVVLRS